jgi:hypothetical protein
MTVAPPGSFISSGLGLKCPKGTFATQHNTNTACQPCSPGYSTATEGSRNSSDCTLAARGYFLKADFEAGGQDVGEDGPPPLQIIFKPQVAFKT